MRQKTPDTTSAEPGRAATTAAIPVAAADAILQAAAALEGASDALAYRAAAEGDEMLALVSRTTDDQAAVLRGLAR